MDVTGQGFKLECQAANEATFRVPDQRGWRPQQRVIDDHPGLHLGSALSTSLDVPALEGAGGWVWIGVKDTRDVREGMQTQGLPLPPPPRAAAAEVLRGRGHAATVQQSQDAGRFVCNWCYYHSLLNSQMARQAKGAPLHALFLHVPPTAAIPLDCQFAFLLDLLDAIAQQLTGGAAVAAAAGDSGGAAGKQQRQSPPEPAALR